LAGLVGVSFHRSLEVDREAQLKTTMEKYAVLCITEHGRVVCVVFGSEDERANEREATQISMNAISGFFDSNQMSKRASQQQQQHSKAGVIDHLSVRCFDFILLENLFKYSYSLIN